MVFSSLTFLFLFLPAVLLHVGHEAVGPGNETGRLHMFVSHFFPLLLLFPLFLPNFLSKKVTQNSN